MLALFKELKAIYREALKDLWKAAQAAQPGLVIYHPKSLAGPHIAEKLGIPAILAVPVPVIVPTARIGRDWAPKLAAWRLV